MLEDYFKIRTSVNIYKLDLSVSRDVRKSIDKVIESGGMEFYLDFSNLSEKDVGSPMVDLVVYCHNKIEDYNKRTKDKKTRFLVICPDKGMQSVLDLCGAGNITSIYSSYAEARNMSRD